MTSERGERSKVRLRGAYQCKEQRWTERKPTALATASILSLCYSSSSFERSTNSDSASERGDLDRESAVLEPYLYEPEDSDSHGSAEEESSDSQDEERLSNKEW